MKNLSSTKKIKRLILASLVSFTAFASAHAQVINFDVAGTVTGQTYSGLGAAPDTGTIWNDITRLGTTAAGLYSNGVQSSITLTDSASNSYLNGGPSMPNGTPLALEQGFFLTNGTVTETLNNVGPGTYNLYLYGKNAPNDSRGSKFTLLNNGAVLRTVNTSNSPTTFTLGDDYVEFTNIVLASTGSITFAYAPNTNVFGTTDYTGRNGEGDYNGLQLVKVAPTPEPGTYALIILGFGSLVGFKVLRRRNHAA